jgi:hypothetical protein
MFKFKTILKVGSINSDNNKKHCYHNNNTTKI